jgi:lipopolysaccharide export system protein LptA
VSVRITLVGVTTALLLTAGAKLDARAADVEVGEKAGQAIGKMADAVKDFRLQAAPADLNVEARSMVFDFKKGQLVYQGDVHVRHGEVKMDADQLQVTFEPNNPNKVQKIEATGNVHVLHQTETASGRLAVYDPIRATITLTGDARLGSGPNTVQGEKVVVFLDEGRATVEGGTSGPVRAYIEPNAKSIDRLTGKEKGD